jgi:HEPN domain-containing protein
VNRKDLQRLANLRLREAQVLFRAKQYSGAYYLAGYAVECALKACIARSFQRHEFPNRKKVVDCWTHNLKALLQLADLEDSCALLAQADPAFRDSWRLTLEWSEQSRYQIIPEKNCRDFLNAIINQHASMPWIKRRW